MRTQYGSLVHIPRVGYVNLDHVVMIEGHEVYLSGGHSVWLDDGEVDRLLRAARIVAIGARP